MKHQIEETTIGSNSIVELAINDIIPDPKNRKDHDQDALVSLANEIGADGLLNPITVRRLSDEEKGVPLAPSFMLIAGERRWRAHKILEKETILARVIEPTDATQAVRLRLAENLHREDLSPIERANGLQELVDLGMSQGDIAKFIGAGGQSTVANLLRLRSLPAKVRAMVHDGRLSRAHGVALCRWAKWPAIVEAIAEHVIDDDSSAKELERADGLPYAWQLRDEGLAWMVDWSLPEPQVTDENADVWFGRYCVDKAVFDAEVARLEAKESASQAKHKAKAGASETDSKAAAERKRKIEQNKVRRADVARHAVVATDKLKSDVKKAQEIVLTLAIEHNHRARGYFKDAAEALGIKLPEKLKRSMNTGYASAAAIIENLTIDEGLRICAAAAVLQLSKEAEKFAQEVPELVQAITGKLSSTKPAEPAKPSKKAAATKATKPAKKVAKKKA